MSAHKIMDSNGNLTDRETPLRYLKIGDRVTHTEERPDEIATVVRSAGDHIVIQWAEGLSYGALPKYLRTVTVDPKPATYALDDVMEAFGITREELKTETTQGEAMTTKGGLLKADFFPSGDLTTAAGNVVSIMQNNEAVALCIPVTVEQPDSIAFKREDVPRVIEELQRALDTENVLVPIYRPKDQP